MKTDVIHLEIFDDIDSIRERLSWSKAARVVLVWPKRGEIHISQVEMILLVRKALQMGIQIALVSGSTEISEMGAAAGIPVFYSQASATLARWPQMRIEEIPDAAKRNDKNDVPALRENIERLREQPEPKPWQRLMVFSAGLAAFFALILFFLPGATVEVFPAEIDQTLQLTMQANSLTKEAALTGSIPLHSLTSLQSASDRIETSGQLLVPDQYARGVVTLENMTDKAQPIPEGTVVTTLSNPPLRFATLSAVEAPAGGEVTVSIEAIEPGSAGNAAAGEITSMEGALGLDLSVMNEEALSGGGETSLRSPSEDDVNTLREKVKSMLLAQARTALIGPEENQSKFFEESLKIDKIIKEEISTPAGKPADFLEISLTGEVAMDYVLDTDMHSALAAAMNANLPAGYEPVDEVINLTPAGEARYDAENNTARWDISGVRKLRSTFSPRSIIQAVTGQSTSQAVQLLSGLMNHRAVPLIHMSPSWWPRLPFLPFRIEVTAS